MSDQIRQQENEAWGYLNQLSDLQQPSVMWITWEPNRTKVEIEGWHRGGRVVVSIDFPGRCA